MLYTFLQLPASLYGELAAGLDLSLQRADHGLAAQSRSPHECAPTLSCRISPETRISS